MNLLFIRRFLFLLACALALAGCQKFFKPKTEWEIYRKNFVHPSGRVIDNANHNISHSEGQGYAMLLAVHYNDPETFELIRSWTFKNLAVRSDSTFAWQWQPSSKDEGRVVDTNNAVDGDLLIAWALLRAGVKWNRVDYIESSKHIAVDLREKYIRQTNYGPVLLPAANGFESEQGVVVNLSYWIFPALRDISLADSSPDWIPLMETGAKLLQEAQFSFWKLPPDWLLLSQPLDCAPQFPPLFGYNAIRIPLYLLWWNSDQKELLRPFYDFWSNSQKLPVTLNLKNGERGFSNSSQGVQAIALWTKAFYKNEKITPKDLPVLQEKEDYFSASLLLLTKMALGDFLDENL